MSKSTTPIDIHSQSLSSSSNSGTLGEAGVVVVLDASSSPSVPAAVPTNTSTPHQSTVSFGSVAVVSSHIDEPMQMQMQMQMQEESGAVSHKAIHTNVNENPSPLLLLNSAHGLGSGESLNSKLLHSPIQSLLPMNSRPTSAAAGATQWDLAGAATNLNDSQGLNRNFTLATAVSKRYDGREIRVQIFHKDDPQIVSKTMSRFELLRYIERSISTDDFNLQKLHAQWQQQRKTCDTYQQAQDVNNLVHSEPAPPGPTTAAAVQSFGSTKATLTRRRSMSGLAGVESTAIAEAASAARNTRIGTLLQGRTRETAYQLPLKSQDIHTLDVVALDTEPFIAIRRLCLVFRIDPYRAIILRDRMLLLMAPAMDGDFELLQQQYQAMCSDDTASNLANLYKSTAFEFKALSLLMDCVVKRATHHQDALEPKIEGVVRNLANKSQSGSFTKELDTLREYKTDVAILESMLERVTAALNDVLNDDSELTFMQLSRFVDQPQLFWKAAETHDRSLCEESQAALEFFQYDINSVVASLDLLKAKIENAERLLMLKLDISRNKLLTFHTFLGLGTVVFAIGSYIGSMFGMNLNNEYETSHAAFMIVTFGTVGGMLVLLFLLMLLLYYVGVFIT